METLSDDGKIVIHKMVDQRFVVKTRVDTAFQTIQRVGIKDSHGRQSRVSYSPMFRFSNELSTHPLIFLDEGDSFVEKVAGAKGAW